MPAAADSFPEAVPLGPAEAFGELAAVDGELVVGGAVLLEAADVLVAEAAGVLAELELAEHPAATPTAANAAAVAASIRGSDPGLLLVSITAYLPSATVPSA